MRSKQPINWRSSGFEFLSIFIAVISAFALNNWNDDRRESRAEGKMLTEIANGLEKDTEDISMNKHGHRYGIQASQYFKKIIAGTCDHPDSLRGYYFGLTRDFISVQNTAGYETLKSKGLELIKNDTLRLQIIALYEYDYNTLRKLEEDYGEMQFHENYFPHINKALGPWFLFDDNQAITGIDLTLSLPEEEERIVLLYLWKMELNRRFILAYYDEIEVKIERVHRNILTELE